MTDNTENVVTDYSHLKNTLARNIAEQRKAMGLTQLELAERLNYSDKAVSKWERAEAVPDVFILKQLAKIFNITLDELTSTRIKKVLTNLKTKKVLVPIISAALAWVAACLAYFTLSLVGVKGSLWLVFIYAVPASLAVLLVFSCLFKKPVFICVFTSLIIWTAALAVFLSLMSVEKIELVFIVAAPLQVIAVLGYFLLRKKPTK